MIDIDIAQLKKVLEEFYNITNILVVIFDDERKSILSYPHSMCDFCRMVRTNEELAEKCRKCDHTGFDECDKTGEPYIYKCHMNLYEAVAPIREDGVTIGYMMIGQILGEDSAEDVKKQSESVSRKYGFDAVELENRLKRLPMVNKDFIKSCVSIVSMCVCYLYYNKIIKKHTDVLSYRLKSFVEAHLCEKISIECICEKMFISKSKLYQLSLNTFGMGVTDYIRKKRLEMAMQLLQADSDERIGDIAEKCGFGDANYFTRVFAKETGMTPKRYRQKFCEK